MDTSLVTSVDRKILQAFYVQYTAILLIILSFMIGSLTTTKPPAIKLPPNASSAEGQRSPISVIEASDSLRLRGDLSVRIPELQAVTWILKNHDVNALIEISPSAIEKQSNMPPALDQAMQLGTEIGEYLSNEEIPLEAFRIRIAPIEGFAGVKLTLFDDRPLSREAQDES